MIKKSTPKKKTSEKKELNNEIDAQTLNFLRLFARSYHVEKKMPPSLNGICLN